MHWILRLCNQEEHLMPDAWDSDILRFKIQHCFILKRNAQDLRVCFYINVLGVAIRVFTGLICSRLQYGYDILLEISFNSSSPILFVTVYRELCRHMASLGHNELCISIGQAVKSMHQTIIFPSSCNNLYQNSEHKHVKVSRLTSFHAVNHVKIYCIKDIT